MSGGRIQHTRNGEIAIATTCQDRAIASLGSTQVRGYQTELFLHVSRTHLLESYEVGNISVHLLLLLSYSSPHKLIPPLPDTAKLNLLVKHGSGQRASGFPKIKPYTMAEEASIPPPPADGWKHEGVRVVSADSLDTNTAQTPGMNRAAAINLARTGAQKLWAGTVHVCFFADTH